MALLNPSEIREVSDLTGEQKQRIYDFLQGAVYSWCKNRKNEWFSMRDLMGGENTDWDGTPLYELYLKHLNKKSNDPVKEAGKDSGWLLKKVLHRDMRKFDARDGDGLIREYHWVEE
ncbi:cell division protein SepF [Leptospira wolffii]|uniref:cell division protein SepF n=1 Tax=Leptospira wolffii TaxID=409998 RepID=UPI0014382719|nr:cell division protein SepF [Leptospira wolffii]